MTKKQIIPSFSKSIQKELLELREYDVDLADYIASLTALYLNIQETTREGRTEHVYNSR